MSPMRRNTRLRRWAGLVVVCLCISVPLRAAEKSKPKPQAILAGSVFDQAGFALPGIRIEITRQGEKKPRWKVVSDARGEFAVRVPAGPATYVIATASKKHQNQEQTIEIVAHERRAVLFRLGARGDAERGKP